MAGTYEDIKAVKYEIKAICLELQSKDGEFERYKMHLCQLHDRLKIELIMQRKLDDCLRDIQSTLAIRDCEFDTRNIDLEALRFDNKRGLSDQEQNFVEIDVLYNHCSVFNN